MRQFFKSFIATFAVFFVASPVIFFYLLDRLGTQLIALSDWAVARRLWADRLFVVVDRIMKWSSR